MKKQHLTLIELLISMALFSIMITILIKSFSMAVELSSNSQRDLIIKETGTVSLHLLTNDLKSLSSGDVESWYKSTTGSSSSEYVRYDKTLWFYFDMDKKDFRFFKKSTNEGKIIAVQYLFDESADGKGLVRYEKEYTTNLNYGSSGLLNVESIISTTESDSNHYLQYIGLKDNTLVGAQRFSEANRRLPPDLSAQADSDSSIDKSVIIANEANKSVNQSYIIDGSFDLNLLHYYTDTDGIAPDNSGLYNTNTSSIYSNGDIPESLQISFTLKMADYLNNKTFSQSIPVTYLDAYGNSFEQ